MATYRLKRKVYSITSAIKAGFNALKSGAKAAATSTPGKIVGGTAVVGTAATGAAGYKLLKPNK